MPPKNSIFIALIATSIACTSEKGINVNNASPTATFTSHDEVDTVVEGVEVTFTAALSDPDDQTDSLIAKWYADDVEKCDFSGPDENGDSSCAILIEPGMHEIKVEVRDPSNAVGFGIYWLSIIQTNPPAIEIVEPLTDGEYKEGQDIPFEAVASDAEDTSDLLVLDWTSSIDTNFSLSGSPTAAGLYTGTSTLIAGDHTITVTATDTEGKTNSASVDITVDETSAPVVEIVSPIATNTYQINTDITFEATATDDEDASDALTLEWTSSFESAFALAGTWDAANSVFTDAAQLTEGTHTITVTATDTDGKQGTASVDIEVLTCHPFATEIPYDGIDSNCDGLEYLNDANQDGVPDDATIDFDDDHEVDAVLGIECYGEAFTNADNTQVYYLFCDNDQYWVNADQFCIDNGYISLATMANDDEYQAFVTMTQVHHSYLSETCDDPSFLNQADCEVTSTWTQKVRPNPWIGFTRGPACSPLSGTHPLYQSVCTSDKEKYYWLNGEDTTFISADMEKYWINSELSAPNPDEHCAFMHRKGICTDTQHLNRTNCENAGETWTWNEYGFFDLYCDLVPGTGSHSGWSQEHTNGSTCMLRQ